VQTAVLPTGTRARSGSADRLQSARSYPPSFAPFPATSTATARWTRWRSTSREGSTC
jgi:hypothetical protein